MPSKAIKKRLNRYLPSQKDLSKHTLLSKLTQYLSQPRLWHCNRHSIAAACFIGLFVAMIPVPLQMLLAATMAMAFQANLPLSISLVWVSNPITMGPLFYSAYQLGAFLLQFEPIQFSDQLSWQSAANDFMAIFLPLLTGSLLIGVVPGLMVFYMVKWTWRRTVIRRWRQRGNHQLQLS